VFAARVDHLVYQDMTNDEAWQEELHRLRRLMRQYENKIGDDGESTARLANEIIQSMEHLAEMSPNAQVRSYWRDRAAGFAAGNRDVREHILADVGRGLLILLATPFALAGAVLFAAGGIIYGAGSIVRGLGNLLTFGVFN
jgi:hypothetical protein